MSRYTFAGTEPGLTIVAGWDNPLETFFAEVWDGDGPGAGALRLWVGTERRALGSVETLSTRLTPYGEIPPDVARQLRDDYRRRREPTALQLLLGR